MLKVAAIDVGSNAIRMAVGEVDDSWKVKVIENIRIPVRLGQDVFTKGLLDETAMQHTVDAFRRFKRVTKDFGVYRLRAVATSAMREASNSHLLANRIYRASEIKVDIIDGNGEACLIHQADSGIGYKKQAYADDRHRRRQCGSYTFKRTQYYFHQ